MAASLGEAFIDVKASTKGFAKSLATELKAVLKDAQTQANAAFTNIGNSAKAASKAVSKSTQDQVRAQTRAIEKFGAAYQKALAKQVKDQVAADKARQASFDAFGRAYQAALKRQVSENAAAAKAIEKAIADAAKAAATAQRVADQERANSARRTAEEQIAAAKLAAKEQAAAAKAAANAVKAAAAEQAAALAAANKVTTAAGTAISKIGTLAKFASIGVLALGAAMSAIGIQQAGQIQLAQTAFSSLANEIENGGRVIKEYDGAQRQAIGNGFVKELQNLALNSSLALDTLVRTTQQLLSLGFAGDEAKAVVLTVGDALAASGKSGGQLNEDLRGIITAFAQIEGAGRLLAQDLNQITTRVPSATRVKVYNNLARDLGLASKAAKEGSPELAKARKEVIKLAEAGSIDSSLAIKSITEALRDVPGATGALDRVNKTLPGQIEEFKETIRLRLGQAFTDITPLLADKLGALGAQLSLKLIEIGPALQDFVLSFADALQKILPAVLDAVGQAFVFVKQAIDVLGPLIPPLLAVFGQFFVVAGAALSVIKAISDAFNALPSGVQTTILAILAAVAAVGGLILVMIKVTTAIKAVRTAMLALNLAFLANPVFLITAALVALAAAFVIAWQRSETFREIVVTVFHAIAEAVTFGIRVVLKALEELLGAIASAASKVPLIGKKLGGGFREASEDVKGARNSIEDLVDSINNIPTQKTINIDIVTNTTGRVEHGVAQGALPPGAALAQKKKQQKDLADTLKRLGDDSAKTQAANLSDAAKGPSAAETAAKNRAEAFKQAIKAIIDSIDAEFKNTLIDGTRKQIDTALDSLRKKITAAFLAAKKPPPSKLLERIKDDNEALKDYATEREKVLTKLAAATARAQQVADSIVSFGNVISEEAAKIKQGIVDLSRLRIILPGQDALGGTGQTAAQRNAKSFAQSLKDRLAAIKDFQANIKKLIAAGLNKETIDQIISAGVEEGGGVAASLTEAGAATIKSINKSQEAIKKAGEELGNTAADSLFRSGKNVADGLIAGLEERRDEIKAAMKRIADDLVAEIKKQLKERSPSRVMRDRGNYAGQGLALGLLDQAGAVRAAGAVLARASVPQLQGLANNQSMTSLTGVVGGSGRSGSSITNNREINAPINQTFHVNPGVDANALAATIGAGIARKLR